MAVETVVTGETCEIDETIVTVETAVTGETVVTDETVETGVMVVTTNDGSDSIWSSILLPCHR